MKTFTRAHEAFFEITLTLLSGAAGILLLAALALRFSSGSHAAVVSTAVAFGVFAILAVLIDLLVQDSKDDDSHLRSLAIAAAPLLLEDLHQADKDLAAGRSKSMDKFIEGLDSNEQS
jgi:hypothetical protein